MWILDGRRPVQVTFFEWVAWAATVPADIGLVEKTELSEDVGVATTFCFSTGRFETLTRSKTKVDDTGASYRTWDEATEGHARAVEVAKAYAAWACN